MSNLKNNAILIFSGYNQRAVVALCRKLTLMEIQFYIIALSENDPILFSDYSDNVKAIRKREQLDLKEALQLVSKIKTETGSNTLTIAPSSEFLNHFLLNNRKSLEEIGCRIPLVKKELYLLITSKHSFSKLCKEHDLRVPLQCNLNGTTNFPFVAKPFINITKEGKSLYPYIIKDKSDLDRFLWKENKNDFYFEEFVCGASYYLLLQISSDASVKSFSQKNILQQADGKSIILAEPSDIHAHPGSQKIIKMLQAVGFTGLIMIEVRKVNEDLCVIEANPRLWGPLQLLEDNDSRILSGYITDILQLEHHAAERERGTQRKNYFWFNGFVEMVFKNKQVTNFLNDRSTLLLVLKNIANDVYLRKDTLKIFFYELRTLAKGKFLCR